ncbi:MAG: ArdC family protein [Proteobacteria bacterium]|nr:ArdC family protein [Pseudomonadota bacterium]
MKEFERTGEAPTWLQPWNEKGGFVWLCNLDGRAYSGVNVVYLLALQQKAGFPSSTWGTYKAFLDHGGQLLKRERSAKIFFYRSVKIKEKDGNGGIKKDENGDPQSVTIPMRRCYNRKINTLGGGG